MDTILEVHGQVQSPLLGAQEVMLTSLTLHCAVDM